MNRNSEWSTPTKIDQSRDVSCPGTKKRPRVLVFDESDESPPTSHGEDETFNSTMERSKLSQLAKKGMIYNNKTDYILTANFYLQSSLYCEFINLLSSHSHQS